MNKLFKGTIAVAIGLLSVASHATAVYTYESDANNELVSSTGTNPGILTFQFVVPDALAASTTFNISLVAAPHEVQSIQGWSVSDNATGTFLYMALGTTLPNLTVAADPINSGSPLTACASSSSCLKGQVQTDGSGDITAWYLSAISPNGEGNTSFQTYSYFGLSQDLDKVGTVLRSNTQDAGAGTWTTTIDVAPPVPEPASVWMVLAGAAVLGIKRLRRRV